jgi:hypothetical protein
MTTASFVFIRRAAEEGFLMRGTAHSSQQLA